MRFLQENLLDHLKGAEFEQLRASFSARKHNKNSYICTPDSTENRIFIVQSGRARVYLGYEEKEFNLSILSPGDIYSTHTGTFVQALEPMTILVTDIATFLQQMASDSEVNKGMIRVLGNILQSSFGIIDGLVFKDTTCRLLSLLLNEARRQEKEEDGTVVLHLDLSVEQIGRLIGASRQTVSTQLNKLIKTNVLQKHSRGRFIVPDVDQLVREFQLSDCE